MVCHVRVEVRLRPQRRQTEKLRTKIDHSNPITLSPVHRVQHTLPPKNVVIGIANGELKYCFTISQEIKHILLDSSGVSRHISSHTVRTVRPTFLTINLGIYVVRFVARARTPLLGGTGTQSIPSPLPCIKVLRAVVVLISQPV